MKVGGKVAIYKIKKETETEDMFMYNATVVEMLTNRAIPYSNKQECAFYKNVYIYSSVKLHEAQFTKDIPDKVLTYKSGKSFTKKEPKYSFRRISNIEENCIIKISSIEIANMSCWKGKAPLTDPTTNKQVSKLVIYLKDVQPARLKSKKDLGYLQNANDENSVTLDNVVL